MPEWLISPEDSGKKLLTFLNERLGDRYSSRALKRAVESSRCQINGQIERFASTPLGRGDRLTLTIDPPENKTSRSSCFEATRLLYEDDSLLIYNKPAGINSDPQGILKLLRTYHPTLELVHRLDKDTTGVLLLAKQPAIVDKLIEQFKRLEVHKRYVAIVDGNLSESKGSIQNYLGKKQLYHGQSRWGAVAADKGLYAETEWQRLEKGKMATLLALYPKTGRTHQLRVHLAEMGYPILGDGQYGKQFRCAYHPPRYLLHAEELTLIHPQTGYKITAKAPWPADFLTAYQELFS